ncbi:hypothetical protein ACJ6WF_48275 [Streptomyces sp. MMS24-I2-30]|uniref:hypothetical protein n=1 Tax=Streptomyces sp. MMS24-I2-30 TaxID=3351564 RepID=UPI003896AA52
MPLLPSQSATDQPAKAADTDADALFAQARILATQGEHAAATAYAALATAAFTAKAAAAAAPLPIYPGDHAPETLPWCGTCRAPNQRQTDARQPCPRCNSDRLRARRCRYCNVYLEKRPVDGPDEPWRWTDDYNSRSCPQAPDPLADPGDPVPEQDVWPEKNWAVFLKQWHGFHGSEPVTASQLTRDMSLRPYLPRTTYGDFHAVHLTAWFQSRADTDCSGYVLRRAGETTTDDAQRWYVAPAQAAGDT